jgi:hypothetical protein
VFLAVPLARPARSTRECAPARSGAGSPPGPGRPFAQGPNPQTLKIKLVQAASSAVAPVLDSFHGGRVTAGGRPVRWTGDRRERRRVPARGERDRAGRWAQKGSTAGISGSPHPGPWMPAHRTRARKRDQRGDQPDTTSAHTPVDAGPCGRSVPGSPRSHPQPMAASLDGQEHPPSELQDPIDAVVAYICSYVVYVCSYGEGRSSRAGSL